MIRRAIACLMIVGGCALAGAGAWFTLPVLFGFWQMEPMISFQIRDYAGAFGQFVAFILFALSVTPGMTIARQGWYRLNPPPPP
jgi:hypothetical protein